MFRVKICGVTNVEDATAAVEAGADAIGLNFYEGSPRYLTSEAGGKIISKLNGRSVCPVGVFVNAPYEDVIRSVYQVGLSAVQLHGDEPAELVAQLKGRASGTPRFLSVGDAMAALQRTAQQGRKYFPNVVRARRISGQGVAPIADDLRECLKAGNLPDAVLVDAMTPGRYGGTGETVSWVGLADYKRWLGGTPLILAGGLTPDNVAEAIRIVRPAAVDVASGVESAPGKKDPAKVRDFVANALGAFAALECT
jgi:phosphoribosylanthranilate isomerase